MLWIKHLLACTPLDLVLLGDFLRTGCFPPLLTVSSIDALASLFGQKQPETREGDICAHKRVPWSLPRTSSTNSPCFLRCFWHVMLGWARAPVVGARCPACAGCGSWAGRGCLMARELPRCSQGAASVAFQPGRGGRCFR